jgi:Icc protein
VAATVLAQLSDPHMRLGPEDEGAGAALEAAVLSVLALDPLPDAVVVTGDLADGAAPAEYERVRELLAPLPMPVHLLPGNHDDSAAVGASYAVRVGDLRLVACDSTIPGRDDGELDLEWLGAELAREPQAPTIVAMHHPPILTGIGGLDVIGLPAATRVALAGLLERSPQVRRVIAGHVHRGAFGVVGGCGVVVCPSTNLQAKLEIGAEGFTIVREPPAFAVHALLDGELVSHLQPV